MNKKKAIISVSLLLTSSMTCLAMSNPTSKKLDTDSLTNDTIKKEKALGGATVVARRKRNTENAIIGDQRRSLVVQSAVSAQQIEKTQDKDASEVIRRIPGVSIVDEKFVMVRGLSQRYNNVWMNGGAVPSSEADSRAFSFDIVPSSQIENMTIVKSPAAEYPADFTGGFIMINTKEMPDENSLNVSLGTSINDQTHFRSFLSSKGKHKMLSSGTTLPTYAGTNNIDILASGMNNNWNLENKNPLPDIKTSASYAHAWKLEDGTKIGMLATANFSNTSKSNRNMENSLFGAYDELNNRPVYLRQSTDNQYTKDSRLGAMLNLTLLPAKGSSFEWKNIFNGLWRNRYTERKGYNANDKLHNFEYYASNRNTYNTQLTGKHRIKENKIDWNVGYAYAGRTLPDRRMIEINDRTNEQMGLYSVGREYTQLDEHILSASGNWQRKLMIKTIEASLKAGIYGEWRTREYSTRDFNYSWNPTNSTLPSDFQFSEDITSLLASSNYGSDKLYMQEDINWTNNYGGRNTMGAGYLGLNLPIEDLNVYAGLRYEYDRMELITNRRQNEKSSISTFYTYSDLFPSLNLNYKLTPKHQLRLAYGESVNRPEFRELSPVVYYDFDLASNVQGNADLKACYIHNFDFRWEWYPKAGEMVSVALFYKRFNNPIEWTYTVNGGTDLTYSNKNAKAANNYGIEVDLKKNLAFIGLPCLDLSFNGSIIKSLVEFEKGSREQNRAMQGQSPYLINTGLFYQNKKAKISASLLYNIIGKRLVGVGRSLGTSGSEDTKNIPNSYEMPRNSIDINLSKKLGKHWEIKAAVRDLLAQKVKFQQIETVNGRDIEEITKSYKPGRNYSITLSYKL